MPASSLILDDMPLRSLPLSPATLTLPPEASVSEAMSLMIQREINHIPLRAADGRFAGLISSNSILRALMPASTRVESLSDALPTLLDHLRENADRPVSDLTEAGVEPIRQDTHLMKAARQLASTASPLPVVNEGGILLGLLSRHTLLTYLLDKSKGH